MPVYYEYGNDGRNGRGAARDLVQFSSVPTEAEFVQQKAKSEQFRTVFH